MSVTATAVILGALVVLLIRSRALRVGGAVICVVFGLVLGATPAGPAVGQMLDAVGGWIYTTLRGI